MSESRHVLSPLTSLLAIVCFVGAASCQSPSTSRQPAAPSPSLSESTLSQAQIDASANHTPPEQPTDNIDTFRQELSRIGALQPVARIALDPPLNEAAGIRDSTPGVFARGSSVYVYQRRSWWILQDAHLEPWGAVENFAPLMEPVSLGATPYDPLALEPEWLLGSDGVAVAALSLDTGQRLWSYDAQLSDVGRQVQSVVPDPPRDAVVLVTQSRLAPQAAELTALSIVDGHVHWKATTAPVGGATSDPEAELLYLLHQDLSVEARQLDDGSLLWRRDAHFGNNKYVGAPLVRTDIVLVNSGAYCLDALDPTSGNMLWQQCNDALDVARGMAFYNDTVITPWQGLQPYSDVSLISLSLKTGEQLWQSTPTAGPASVRHPHFVVVDDFVYACLDDGILRALSAKDGQQIWSWGVGSCASFAVVSRPGRGPQIIAGVPSGEVWIFEPSEAPAPMHRVTISVALAEPVDAPIACRVGDQHIETDGKQPSEVSLDARGVVSIDCDNHFPAWVEVEDGRVRFDVTLEQPSVDD